MRQLATGKTPNVFVGLVTTGMLWIGGGVTYEISTSVGHQGWCSPSQKETFVKCHSSSVVWHQSDLTSCVDPPSLLSRDRQCYQEELGSVVPRDFSSVH